MHQLPRCFDAMVATIAADARHVLRAIGREHHDDTAPPEGPEAAEHGFVLMRAMLAAAKCDGTLNEEERERLLDCIGCAEFDPDVREWLQREFRGPLDLDAVAAGAKGSFRRAVEIYIASVVAIDIDAKAEFAWLARLAGRLGLDTATIGAVHRKLGAPAPAA